MRLGIEGSALLGPRTGIGRYTLNLLRALAEVLPKASLQIFLLPGIRGRRVRPDAVRTIEAAWGRERVKWRTPATPGLPLKGLWWTLGAPTAETWTGPVEVFHGANFFLPPLRRGRGIVTVHDVAYRIRPELHVRHLWMLDLALRRSLPFCSRVITPSESTRRDFLRLYPFPEDRVHVIALSADPVFRPLHDREALNRARSRLGLPERFVLSAGTLEPRKNLDGVLEGFRRALPRLPRDCSLVLAGVAGWKSKELLERVARSDLSNRVRYLGFLDDADLAAAMNLARCVLYPSHYEGFGLPVLEAMACGTPVLTSNVSSLPEVAEDAAVLVAPEDTDAIAEGVERLVRDPRSAREFGERGLRRAARFSWERTARETAEVYRREAASSGVRARRRHAARDFR